MLCCTYLISSSTRSALAPNSIASTTFDACEVDPEESRVEKCFVSKVLVTPGGVGRFDMNALMLLQWIKLGQKMKQTRVCVRDGESNLP